MNEIPDASAKVKQRALRLLAKRYPKDFEEILEEERKKEGLTWERPGARHTPADEIEARRKKVRALKVAGLTYTEIGRALKISHATAWNIDHEED